jgi:hypothetical protein
MGIAGVEPHQLAPSVGTTGSGSTDSPAPSPTIADLTTSIGIEGSSPATIVDSAPSIAINNASSAINIDIAIASPVIDIDIDNTSPTNVDATASTNVNTARPTTPASAANSLVTTTVEPISSSTGSTSAKTGGFDMAFGLFNFHVDGGGVAKLISISKSTPPVADPSTPPAIGNAPSITTPLMPSVEDPRLETSTPSVGSNDFQDPPPSPTTAYCVECNAYHFVGAGDFSSHEITGCKDPRGGIATIYPMISECERAINALMLHPTPYDPDYVKGLHSDYTCSDDDVYPEANGKIGNSASSYSSESAISGSGYVVDYDSDTMIEVGSCIGDDDIYPLVQGEISDDSISPFGGHYIMASHRDGNEHNANNNRVRSNASGQFITQNQIQHARKVYLGKVHVGPNPTIEEIAVLRFIIQEHKE